MHVISLAPWRPFGHGQRAHASPQAGQALVPPAALPCIPVIPLRVPWIPPFPQVHSSFPGGVLGVPPGFSCTRLPTSPVCPLRTCWL